MFVLLPTQLMLVTLFVFVLLPTQQMLVNVRLVAYTNDVGDAVYVTLGLILSASRFLTSGSPLLVPAPFLFSVHQHGMTVPFLSDRNPLWTHSSVN